MTSCGSALSFLPLSHAEQNYAEQVFQEGALMVKLFKLMIYNPTIIIFFMKSPSHMLIKEIPQGYVYCQVALRYRG